MNFQDIKTRPKVLGGILSPMILLLILGAASVFSIKSIVETNASVDHTHVVLEKSAEVIGSAVDMETGMRGYLLAGKDGFLDPYKNGEKATYKHIEELQKTVSDNPGQVARLDEVRDVLKEWQEKVTEPTIALRSQIGDAKTMNDMAKLVAEARGKTFFDKFREQISTFIGRESTLLKKRRGDFETAQTAVDEQFGLIQKTIGWVTHTYKVLASAEKVLANAVDMETGMRGFLLAGEEEFLDPYKAGKSDFFKNIAALQQTVSDNPPQVARLKEAEKLISDWNSEVTEPAIKQRRDVRSGIGSLSGIADMVGEKKGKKFFDAFRKKMAEFSALEAKLLVTRQADAKTARYSVDANLKIMKDNEQWVTHTYKVIGRANATLASAVDMETGMRGYLLAGQEDFLAPYTTGRETFGQLSEGLKATVSDNPAQVKLMTEIQQTLAGWQKEVTEPTIKLRRDIGDGKTMDDMADLVSEARGKVFFDKFRALMTAFTDEEESLMDVRKVANKETISNTYITITAGIVIALAIGLALAWYIGNGIANPLANITNAVKRLAAGDANVQVPGGDRKDELGDLARSLMTINTLSEDNARVKSALDDCQANVMVADIDQNIIYMNKAMVSMMQRNQAALKSDLPSFDSSQLLGTNIDTFHSTPSHQRGIIGGLTAPLETTIKVGGLTLNLIVSPVSDSEGTRIGTVVEWDDVTEKLAAEAEAARVVNENMRVKVALDNCSANVMVADNDYDIVYMNGSAVNMMTKGEQDLRKDLPNFDASKLIGTSIDDFHKNPAHQRGVLEGLISTYEGQIVVGGRTYDLVANPIVDENKERLGTVVEWDDVTEKLAEVAEEKRIAGENMRVKVALDNCSANVMVADNSFDIVYMNEAVVDMMKNAEQDIRGDLPGFDTEKLIGTSIDDFHKNPAHQRGVLETLKSTYDAQIKVGGRSFDLVANPIVDNGGERLGTVVEWSDVTQELAIQNEVDNMVSAVVAGDFSQTLNLDGKEGFMLGLSTSMNQINDTVKNVFEDVGHALSSLSDGDLTNQITNDYSGAYNSVKEDSNKTSDQLMQIVSDIIGSANDINSASGEIAAGSNDLSARTETQASSLEETAASMEEMSATVKQNAESAQQANQFAANSRSVATRGGEVVKQAVDAMSRIEDSSKKVSDIIGVIDEIAFQTNLLALNAAVEAARAGDAGKGFAVVASEVRTLAQRSSEAAKDIKELILNSDGLVKEGVEHVDSTGKTLDEIVESITKVADIISEIAAASNEQSSSVEEINSAVTEMDEMTQQNAALVEQSSAAANSLQEQSENLIQMVAFFDLGEQKDDEVIKARPEKKPASKKAAPKKPKTSPAGAAASTDSADDWQEF
jgi:methyl-accepting chemotaxis protein